MKGFKPSDAEKKKSVTASCSLVEGYLPESASGLTLALDRVSAIICLNFPYLPPPCEGTDRAFSMGSCIPEQKVAVPCLPTGEGSAGTHASLVTELAQIHLACCSGCFYVPATSVYVAVRCWEVLQCHQFLPEKERQSCKAGDPTRRGPNSGFLLCL